MVTMFPQLQFFDDTGEPLNAGLIYTYAVGTTTPKTVYQNYDDAVAGSGSSHANPAVLSAAGRLTAPIWTNGGVKLVIKTSAGVALNPTIDNFNVEAGVAGSWATKESVVQAKAAAYTLTTADDGTLLVCTNTWTMSTASVAATMGDGYVVTVANVGTGVITFNPTGTEQIQTQADPAANFLDILPGETWEIRCNGAKYWGLRNEYTAYVRFLANKNDAQALADGAATTITGWDEIYDNGSNFAANAFTAPVAGVYLIGATCSVDNILDTKPAYIALNFSTAETRIGTRMTSSATQDLNLEVVTLASLALGETCQVEVFINNGAGLNTLATSEYHSFWGLRVA